MQLPIRLLNLATRLAVSLLLFVTGTVLAQDPDAIRQYGEAIRARSLFLVGEEDFLRRLENPKLSPAQRTAISLQLSRMLFEHGILEIGQGRKQLWDRSLQTLKTLIESESEPSEKAELRVEPAILESEQAGIVAWEATLSPESIALRDDAIARLSSAVKSLQVQLQELSMSSSWPKRDRESPAVLERLRTQNRQRLQLHRAECDLWNAQLTEDPRKRISLLIDVENQLENIGRIAGDPETTFNLLIFKIRRARLANNEKLFEQLLTASQTGRMNISDQDALLSERLRMEFARGDLAAAFDLLRARLKEDTAPSSELRAVAVHGLLLASDQALQAGKTQDANDFLEQARRQHDRVSGRWRLESGTRLQRFQQDQEYGPEVAQFVRQANAEWHSNHRDQAAERFAQASRAAITAGKTDQAFSLGLQSVALLIELSNWNSADALLSELLKQSPQHARAADADLLRCYVLGRTDPSGQAFQQAAQEHLRRFSDSVTRWDVIRMLGASKEARSPAEAIAWYRQIPDDQPLRNTADLRTLSLYLAGLAQPWLKDSSEQQSECREAIRRVEQRLKRIPSPWTTEQCQIGLLAVRLLSSPLFSARSEAQTMLASLQSQVDAQQALSSRRQEQLSQEWQGIQKSVIQLRVVALAAEGDLAAARTLLQSMLTGDTILLMNVLSGLNEVATQLPADQLYELGHLRLQIIRALAPRRESFTPDQQMIFDRITAESYFAAEDWAGAISSYTKLSSQYADRKEFVSPLIQALLKQGLREDLNRALALSRQLERQLKSGSTEWIAARIQQAEILKLQGDVASARKLIAVTRTLYPQMGSPELKLRAEQVLQ